MLSPQIMSHGCWRGSPENKKQKPEARLEHQQACKKHKQKRFPVKPGDAVVTTDHKKNANKHENLVRLVAHRAPKRR